VPVNHRPRARGVSNYGNLDRLIVGISDLVGVMWLKRRARVPVIVEDAAETVTPSYQPAQPDHALHS
jgi:dolichol-phosphate mannosyltransferase